LNGSACMPSGMLLGMQELTRSRRDADVMQMQVRSDAQMMQRRCRCDAKVMQRRCKNMPIAVHEPMHRELCQGSGIRASGAN